MSITCDINKETHMVFHLDVQLVMLPALRAADFNEHAQQQQRQEQALVVLERLPANGCSPRIVSSSTTVSHAGDIKSLSISLFMGLITVLRPPNVPY